MTHVSIIGTGNMGQAISRIVTAGGNTVETFDQSEAGQPVTGDIVVLAVPYPAVADVIAKRSEQLAGKVVVDITNPLNFETFDSLTVPADGSAAAEIAAELPQSRVLKAFNTTFAATVASGTVASGTVASGTVASGTVASGTVASGTVASGTVGPLPTTVLIAGDDADAKALLAGVVAAGGLRAVDVGSLRRARELEALGFLQLTLAVGEKLAWTGGFGVVA